MTRSFRSTSGTQLLRTSFGRFGSCADDLRAVAALWPCMLHMAARQCGSLRFHKRKRTIGG